MQILDVILDIIDFIWKKSWKPQLSPWSSLLIFKNQGKLNNFSNGRFAILWKLNGFIFGFVFYLYQSVMCHLIDERMLSKVDKIQQNTTWPHVAFWWVLFVHKLLRRGVNRRPFVKWKVTHFGDVVSADTPGASKVCYFDDKTFRNENVLRFQVSMENSFDVHWNKSLYDLFEDFEYFSYCEGFVLLFVVMKQVTLLAVLHQNFNCFFILLHLVVVNFD